MHGNSGHYSRGHAVYVGSGLALGAETAVQSPGHTVTLAAVD